MSRAKTWRSNTAGRRASYDRLPALAADLVGRKVDLIVTGGGLSGARGEKARPRRSRSSSSAAATRSRTGLVASLARPGGNLTGVSILADELMPKRLELLSELVPQAKVIALLVNPNNPNAERIIARRAGSGAREGGAAPYPEGRHRKRDRRRLRRPRPTASRRARRRRRSVLQQPARAARGAGITPCRSGDL